MDPTFLRFLSAPTHWCERVQSILLGNVLTSRDGEGVVENIQGFQLTVKYMMPEIERSRNI